MTNYNKMFTQINDAVHTKNLGLKMGGKASKKSNSPTDHTSYDLHGFADASYASEQKADHQMLRMTFNYCYRTIRVR